MRAALAVEQRQLADQGLDQRRLAGAVRAQQADAVAGLQAEADLVQDPRAHRWRAVALRDVARVHVVEAQQRVRQLQRLAEVDVQVALGAHGFGAGELGQALHPRLRLLGLAGLGLEAVDELLQVRALDLLLLESDLLLAQVLGALALEGGVVARIQLGLAFVQVQRVRGHAVEELAVVRDQQQRAGVLEQPLLQPQHRVQVEVVGGLVEQQQVGRAHQGAREVEAHAPAAGERRHGALVRLGRKAQAVQQAAGAGLGVVAVHLGELLVAGGDRVVVLARHGVGLGPYDHCQRGVAAEHELDRGIGQRRRFLRDAGDAHAAGQVEVALVGFHLAEDRGEQARLAATVAAHHAHAPAGVQGQVDVGQQQALAPAQGEIT